VASCPRKEVSHGSGNPTVRSVGLKAKKGAVRATGGRVGYPDPRMGSSPGGVSHVMWGILRGEDILIPGDHNDRYLS
jgi:hypothetical protein